MTPAKNGARPRIPSLGQADRLARRIMTLFDRGLRDFDLIAAKAANAEEK
ncbi:hypothetical protein [Phyllobacterium zundukense]|uniref:Uncharacterized protein n=1 Tax=Phyllobacterium zundukense TaxID=1867719 RepID=A0ACD4CYB8_9HYPH|nr:hypothetical protein [Phyllobacterium zundukense]UXN58458.1 hypothetical protein N8E88_10495 [Phyllobacterium zundukense]